MNYDEIKNKHIAVLLSGGVDSSVVVYEFARLGLTPDASTFALALKRRKNGIAIQRKT